MRRAQAAVNRTTGVLTRAVGRTKAPRVTDLAEPLDVRAALRFDEVRAWLFDKALPLWSEAGLDRRHGGAAEVLDLEGRAGTGPFKRTRVQARQVYAFSHARLLGWDGPAEAAADHCWRFLREHGRRADGAWIRLIAREGGAFDANADAYDIASVLYALAWRARAGDAGAIAEAHEAVDALDRLLRVGPGLGWRAAEDNTARLQNPHMHMLEGALDLAEASGEQRFADMAREIMVLFSDRMFDRMTGVLPENFADDWTPERGPERWVQPGHLYEWAWLLYRARRVVDIDLSGEARALCDFADRRGRDPDTGLTWDALDGQALTPRRTFRAWPQAEALKASLALFEHQGIDTRPRIAELMGQLLDRYLAVTPDGSWQDCYGPGYRPLARDVPASILYHLILAFSELLRLEPQLSRAPSLR